MSDPGEDLLQVMTVLLLPGVQPGAVDPRDLSALGEPAREETVRTPILSRFTFARGHVVQIQDPQVLFITADASHDALDSQQKAVGDFLDTYAGPKSVEAIGHNIAIRRRHPETIESRSYFRSIIQPSIFEALETRAEAEANLELLFTPPFCTRATARLEPSRVSDPDAVFFAFNFHFQLRGDEDGWTPVQAVDALENSVLTADRIANALLSAIKEGG